MSWDALPYKVQNSFFEKKLKVPTSKSYANRLLILAAIETRPVELIDLPDSSDVQVLLDCLEKIGLRISRVSKNVIVHNSFPACEKEGKTLVLESGDGGTTNRFLMAFLARGKRPYRLKPSGRIKDRPVKDFLQALEQLGVKVTHGNKNFWYEVQGPLPPRGKVKINCAESTQFATSLILALVDTDIEVELEDLRASQKYLALTKKLVSDFKNKNLTWIVPPDWSGASYPLALGLLEGAVLIENCNKVDPWQADCEFLSLIKAMGGYFSWQKNGLALAPPCYLEPIDSDGSFFPDLVPTLAFVCSYAKGTSTIRNLGVLRHKECDRVKEILRLLCHFEVKHSFDRKTHTLVIHGSTQRVGYREYIPPKDHRMVMVAYLFMRHNGGGLLYRASYVAKSFPHFFEALD